MNTDTLAPHRIEAAREWLRSGGSVLLFGPTAPNLSAFLDTLPGPTTDARILRCSPTQADSHCAFRALATLLSSVTDAELDAVPARRRSALTILGCQGAGHPVPMRSPMRPPGRRATRATPADVRLPARAPFRVLATAGPPPPPDTLGNVDGKRRSVLRPEHVRLQAEAQIDPVVHGSEFSLLGSCSRSVRRAPFFVRTWGPALAGP